MKNLFLMGNGISVKETLNREAGEKTKSSI